MQISFMNRINIELFPKNLVLFGLSANQAQLLNTETNEYVDKHVLSFGVGIVVVNILI